jgi:hypothetical protein
LKNNHVITTLTVKGAAAKIENLVRSTRLWLPDWDEAARKEGNFGVNKRQLYVI